MSNGKMSTSRVEAFSDGVIAIIVTVMVLQLTHPAQPTLAALVRQSPIFLSYALSFSRGRHHVGQPPSSDPRGARGERAPAMGEPQPAVLDVPDPVCNGFSWAQPACALSGVTLRLRSRHVRVCLLAAVD
ncbi:MAG: hypothetical protein DMG83_16740 [Acidobacteria bacterium]|nr:MAG: hypothetical protein DMG83_16740 [Acidobacteriota bacterium]